MREKLLGYPRNLSVYETTSCPQNESSWKASAQRLGCNLEIVDPYINFYYCIPTKSTSRLVEFCYDRSSKGQGKGRCLVLGEDGMHDSFDCTHFTQGCPDTHYYPETIYNYPACLNINTEKRCYSAEEGCPPPTSTVAYSTLEYSTTDPETTSHVSSARNDFLSSTSFREFTSPSVSGVPPQLGLFAVFAVTVIVVFIISLAAMLIKRKRENRRNGRIEDDEGIELIERETLDQLRVEIDNIPSSIVFGMDVEIKGRLEFHQTVEIIAWLKGDECCDTEIDITKHKYNGSSIDPKQPILRINSADFSDKGSYQLTVNGTRSNTTEIIITGSVPTISISGIKIQKNATIIICDVKVTSESPQLKSIKWSKNGHEINRIMEPKYIRGSINNPSLTIMTLDKADTGKYQCAVNNDIGTVESEIFYLDKVLAVPLQVQLLLCFMLLQENYEIDMKEEFWLPSLCKTSRLFDCKVETREQLKALIKRNEKELGHFTIIDDNVFKYRSDIIRNEVLSAFKKIVSFADLFVDCAHKDNISEYCRTSSYKGQEDEVYLNLNPKQSEIFIEKLKDDILGHPTMKDEASLPLIADKLKIPVEILQKQDVEIQKYVRQLENGKVFVYHARGMIVGCAEAGKTTLLKKLKGLPQEEVRNTESTRGVDIQADVFEVLEEHIQVTSSDFSTHFSLFESTFYAEKAEEKVSNYNDCIGEEFNLSVTDEQSEGLVSATVQATTGELKDQFTEDQTETADGPDSLANNTKERRNDRKDNLINLPTNAREVPGLEVDLIHLLSLFLDMEKRPSRTITFLDFAGHVAYYVTHQMFLSPRAFYVLVLDMTKDFNDIVTEGFMFIKWTYKDQILHWMKLIHAFHGISTPVILVATHSENKSSEEVNTFFVKLWKLLPGDLVDHHLDHTRQFAVELEKDSNIEEINSCILSLVENQAHWGEQLPKAWAILEKYLRKTKEKIKVMKTEDLWKENEKIDKNIQVPNKEDFKSMLKFFHDTGTIIYFDDDSLKDAMIIDLQWFVDAFKHIITYQIHANSDFRKVKNTFGGSQEQCVMELENLMQKGILTSTVLRSIWKLFIETRKAYECHKNDVMMYMEKLGMLAKLSDEPETWYIPCMNQRLFQSNVYESFDVSSTICFQYNFLPRVIFYRLVAVCLHQEGFSILEKDENEKVCMYQAAVVLKNERCQDNCLILIGNVHDNIEVQLLYNKNTQLREGALWLKLLLMDKLQNLTKTFHTNIGEFKIGYRCRKTLFCEKPTTHIQSENSITGRSSIYCEKCPIVDGTRNNLRDFERFWNSEVLQSECPVDVENGNTESINKKKRNIVITLESNFVTPERVEDDQNVDGCCHISCMSKTSAWISDRLGQFWLIDTNGNIMERDSEIIPYWSGTHTLAREKEILSIQHTKDKVFRIRGRIRAEERIIPLQGVKFTAFCIFYSVRSKRLHVGGRDTCGLVQRYNSKNELELVIRVDSMDKLLYIRPWHITENVNGDVLVSDYDRQMVVAVDRAGRHRFNYAQRQSGYAFTPRGICTDLAGNILVCDLSSESVHVLTSNGELLCQIQTYEQEVTRPFGICFDQDNRLWVGDLSNHKICIYRYSHGNESDI